ncbi:MAG: pyruvate kinase [Spirochaetota bacterium]
MRKTKIICTLGPATDSDGVLEELIKNGMNVARINCSHGNHEEHLKRIDAVKKIRSKLKRPVALMLDTRGPEIRVGTMKNGFALLETGRRVTLVPEDIEGTDTVIPISYPGLCDDLGNKRTILIDDGRIELEVISCKNRKIECVVTNSGKVSSRKGVNVPGVRLNLPAISEKDRSDILFGIKQDIDYVAASFVRKGDDVLAIRKLLDNNGGWNIKIISKIENSEGVDNINSILVLSDGVMVARGDLGVEVSFEQVPQIQKSILRKAIAMSKPAIIATQMLDSMISSPRPTRAEVSDVANAIYDSTSAIMLSGETAMGKYPVECLRVMARTAEITENNIEYQEKYFSHGIKKTSDITTAVTNAAVTTAYSLNADAIVVVTKSGRSAASVSRFRPDIPIVACTPEKKVYNQLAINWGIYPIIAEEQKTFAELLESAIKHAKQSGLVKDGDLAVVIAGVPVGSAGMTNLMRVETVGDMIAKGRVVVSGRATGRACVCRSYQEGQERFRDGDILVVPSTDNNYLPLMKRAAGIILENDDFNEHARTVGMTLDIPVMSNARGVLSLIKEGIMIYMDSDKGIVNTV